MNPWRYGVLRVGRHYGRVYIEVYGKDIVRHVDFQDHQKDKVLCRGVTLQYTIVLQVVPRLNQKGCETENVYRSTDSTVSELWAHASNVSSPIDWHASSMKMIRGFRDFLASNPPHCSALCKLPKLFQEFLS